MITLPSLERLRELFDYDPHTGELMRAGKAAGCYKTRYVVVSVDDCMYMAHRIIWKLMTTQEPADQIDHIDRDKHNNRWLNLRAATQQLNNANRPCHAKGVHLKGVTPTKAGWSARICGRHIGTFSTPEAAREAYLEQARQLYGDFAA